MAYPEPFEALIAAFERFPGIGRRSAERLAFHILREPAARDLARAIDHAVETTRRCARCCNVSESDPCAICADETRDAGIICVVEEPRHVEAIERSGAFRGRYHVLMGALNPADGTDREHLNVKRLLARVRREKPREVILGTDPDAEGEATATLVLEALESLGQAGLTITRLARGLPAGSAIEYLHRGVLEDALGGRRPVRSRKSSRANATRTDAGREGVNDAHAQRPHDADAEHAHDANAERAHNADPTQRADAQVERADERARGDVKP